MKRCFSKPVWLVSSLCLLSLLASAQTTLSTVTVKAPAYTSQYGGYLISGDFKVDPRMPFVVFPAQALIEDDILSIQPVHLMDDEYLVLQECATADCSRASLVRVWNASGALGPVQDGENRIWIKHENKYFIWLKRLPEVGSHFTNFEVISPPLTLIPDDELAASHRPELLAAESADPIPVKTQVHEGSTFVVTYVGGSTVRIRRMRAGGN
jgi:hypothetical protein